ncbi:hypothetical protein [Burkholderia sp. Ac-20365]|jgi:hypothetical protein|uniref:hypothetical protein n=1 Tax=Burkholderia sp. Ac-20365 TaxID=2703897 RepID=UPI00197B55A7|nr:hypothetical protein [Burkholderia sp. Ac-20365]MBN3766095.1 hypothetical protein [Burkholderia sp. Ac-20365]
MDIAKCNEMPFVTGKAQRCRENSAFFCVEGDSDGPIQTVKIQNKAKFGAFASAVALPAAFPNLSRPRAKR